MVVDNSGESSVESLDVRASDATLYARLSQLVTSREEDLFARLGEHHLWARWLNPDPEIVRVWGRIEDTLGEISRLLARQESIPEKTGQRLLMLLQTWPAAGERWTLPKARELGYSLTAMLPQIGDDAYLQALIRREDVRKRLAKIFDNKKLSDLADTLEKGRRRKELADMVVMGQLERATSRRKSHAKLAITADQLKLMFAILLPLVIGFGAAISQTTSATASRVALAGLGGAVASMLSGVLKLQKLGRLKQLRFFGAGLLVQPVVGAAAGLFLLLLLHTHIVRLPGAPGGGTPSAAAVGLYAFLAGFSEPFFLGLVQRLVGAGTADEAAGVGLHREGN